MFYTIPSEKSPPGGALRQAKIFQQNDKNSFNKKKIEIKKNEQKIDINQIKKH